MFSITFHLNFLVYLKLYAILDIEKWQSDTSRLLITVGIHQKEQLRYLENIQNVVISVNSTSFSNVDINKDCNKKERHFIQPVSNHFFGRFKQIG